MAISFPSNPSTNQTYTHSGKIWTYNGTRWTTTGPNNYATNTPVAPIIVSDTVPGATVQGSMWADSSTGTLSIYIGGAWVLASAGVINVGSNTIPGTAIVDKSLTSTQIANNTITATQVANYTITATQIANNTITANQLATGAAVPTQTGNSGKYLTTDGTTASWGTVTTTPGPGSIVSSMLASNISIGNLTVTGTSTLGAIGNVKVTGGTSGQLVSTDGTGNLSFINAPSSFNAGKAFTLNLLFGG